MNKKKQILKISILIISIFTILFSLSYAFINIRLQGEKKQVLSAGELSLELEEPISNELKY